MITGFPFEVDFEEAAINAMNIDEANNALASVKEHMEKFQKSKKKGKKAKGKATGDEDQRESSDKEKESLESSNKGKESLGPEGKRPSETKPGPSDQVENSEWKDPDDSSSLSSDEDPDPRKRTSRKDKESIRGRTPRVKSSSKKLFKMEPSAKYKGDTDADRTYTEVHKFLSQLSRYLRLATNVNMKKDISEYVMGYLDGFAFE